MQTVILAGGLGSRLGEETQVRPKPMVEIGGMPILWHIMKIYAAAGLNDFVVCLGYKGYVIKEFFANYLLHTADVTIDLRRGNGLEVHCTRNEPWRVTLVETGAETMTGGRLAAARPYLDPDAPFCFTYGDGLADIDIADLVRFHRACGRRATVTSVSPPGRFGALEAHGTRITGFREKPAGDGGRINGGFFVAHPSVLDLVEGADTVWESGPLERLAERGELSGYRHDGFWHPMDTLRDKLHLDALWQSGQAPWKRW
jgi:glucose-1-phosphate cytidylyltransferase